MKVNDYMDINRIEFSITNACTSRCKHCSVENVSNEIKTSIDKDTAISVVQELSSKFNIESVMTFGGEPLLHADTTCAIHRAAAKEGISRRQIITNGYFSKEEEQIRTVAKNLKESGVNSLLLSIDTFHKEYIPIDKVYLFAKALCGEGISGFKLHPAWVVNRSHDNKYNRETEECLKYFSDLNIPVSNGNNIFLSGNAAIYLSQFYGEKSIDFNMKCGEMPYTEKLDSIKTIAINPNGDVTICCFIIGNVYKDSIIEIINRYNPYENPMMKTLITGGVSQLIKFGEENGITVDKDKFYSACSVCREIVKKFI